MTIQDLGSIGEFVAAVATLVTLAYVAVQIRQNSRLLGETAKRATQATVHEQNLLLFKDKEAMVLVRQGMSQRSSLDPDDRIRFHNFWMTSFINYQEAFYQVKQLGVDDEWWTIIERHMLLYLESPGLADWWLHNKATFGSDFVGFVDGKLAAGGV